MNTIERFPISIGFLLAVLGIAAAELACDHKKIVYVTRSAEPAPQVVCPCGPQCHCCPCPKHEADRDT